MVARRIRFIGFGLVLIMVLAFAASPVSADGPRNALEVTAASTPMGVIVYDGLGHPYLRVDQCVDGLICIAPIVDGTLLGGNTVTPNQIAIFCVDRGAYVPSAMPKDHYLMVQPGRVSDCFQAIAGHLGG